MEDHHLGKDREITEIVDGREITTERPVPVQLDLGAMFGSVLGFVITATVVFFVIVKPMNKLLTLVHLHEGAPPPKPNLPPDVALLTEIRDLLKGKAGEGGDATSTTVP